MDQNDWADEQIFVITSAFEIKCGTNAGINEFPGIAEGRRLEIRCNLTFPRTYSAPLVQWLRDDVKFTVNLIENHNNISAEGLKIMWIFTAMLPLNASDDGAMFACVFTFKPSNVSNGDKDYVYRWNYTAVVWCKLQFSFILTLIQFSSSYFKIYSLGYFRGKIKGKGRFLLNMSHNLEVYITVQTIQRPNYTLHKSKHSHLTRLCLMLTWKSPK